MFGGRGKQGTTVRGACKRFLLRCRIITQRTGCRAATLPFYCGIKKEALKKVHKQRALVGPCKKRPWRSCACVAVRRAYTLLCWLGSRANMEEELGGWTTNPAKMSHDSLEQ